MSPRADRRTADDPDGGFSLVEVIVALGILMSLLVAVLPQLIGGIRATDIARASTQAKALASSELERLRNLPFQVEPNAGVFVDLFDRYFHDLTAPAEAPACTDADGRLVPFTSRNTGYVADSPSRAGRCDWEPDGAFYRTVRTSAADSGHGLVADPSLEGFVVSTTLQFVNSATPPAWIAPRVGYQTQTVGQDTPATSQVRVTVAVMTDRETARRPVVLTSQIARTYQTVTKLRAVADASALDAGTTTSAGTLLSVTGGLLHLDATVIGGSRVELSGSGVSATTDLGQRAGLMQTYRIAPPTGTVTWSSPSAGNLAGSSCQLACWVGGLTTGNWTPRTADGLPGVGTSSSPVEVGIRLPDNANASALEVGAGPNPSFRPGLGLDPTLVRLKTDSFPSGVAGCSHSSSGTGVLRAAAGGWATTSAPPGGASSCAAARTSTVGILPRSDTSLLRVTLNSATASCSVSGLTHTTVSATAAFSVTLSYWDGSTYRPVGAGTYTAGSGSALPAPSSIPIDGGTRTLADYIDSWSVAGVVGGIERSAVTGSARVDVPAVFSMTSVPLRYRMADDGTPALDDAGDPIRDESSVLSVSLGSVSCIAEDRR